MLVLQHVPGEPLGAEFGGPYTIGKKVSNIDCTACTPDRTKNKRMPHVNMLRGYESDDTNTVLGQSTVTVESNDECETLSTDFLIGSGVVTLGWRTMTK